MNASQCALSHFTNVNEKAMHASYLISLRIAQSGQPHTIGESLVLPSIKDAVGVLFGGTYLKEIELIPLSNDTAARRIEDMAKWVEDQLISRVKGISRMRIYCFVNQLFRVLVRKYLKTLDAYVKSKELDCENCVGKCTDGATANV
ncbi:zinc finger protein, partial [Trichinella spiralis]|uniref:zinc finger protein n=1 Tax=Trichinella spiralis TaxID=6334 RepID=UPI0001EFE863